MNGINEYNRMKMSMCLDLLDDVDRSMKIETTVHEKFTIVEIKYGGKYYHGLSAKHPGDQQNSFRGLLLAFLRAREALQADLKNDLTSEAAMSYYWRFLRLGEKED